MVQSYIVKELAREVHLRFFNSPEQRRTEYDFKPDATCSVSISLLVKKIKIINYYW